MDPLQPSPRSLGYRMPAEWEPHDAVWLAWPHDPETFPGRLRRVEEIYLEILGLLRDSETVHLLVRDRAVRETVRRRLEERGVDSQGMVFHLLDYADVWIRDYGPTFLVGPPGRGPAMVHWRFNAWGGKYATHLKDGEIPLRIRGALPCFSPDLILEGGSIDGNGRGTLLTTEQCLLHPNRNPGLDRAGIEEALREYLAVERVIWLKGGIAGDDTDGHVDDVARFVGPRRVVCALEGNPRDANYSALQENLEILRTATDRDGAPLEVLPLPMPGELSGPTGRLPASYANFYIANRVVLVPVFGHENDARACEVLASVFPDRRVVGVRCEDLVLGLGALHCITQQQPASVPGI